MLRSVLILLTLEAASAGMLTNCASCIQSNTCGTCMTGYSVFAGKLDCSACGTGASVCTSATVATLCKTGYRLNGGVCEACQVSNCASCTADKTTCSAGCKPGYYYISGTKTCAACGAHCNVCTSPTACTSCKPGYFGADCKPGPQHCTVATSATACQTCNSGYMKDTSNLCAACSSNCATCTSSTVCSVCKSGYTLSGTSCIACPANCATCPSSGTTCTSCKALYGQITTGSTVCNTCNVQPAVAGAFTAQAFGMIWIMLAQLISLVSR